MKTAAEHAMEVESAYLAGAHANFGPAEGKIIPGSRFARSEVDRGEAVRAAMIDRRVFDRDQYARLPHGRSIILRGWERRWLIFSRLRSVTMATVIAPPEPLLDGKGPAPPVTAAQLVAHVRNLMADNKVPHVIGVCSPSGFAEDVWRHPPELANVKLVLVEPRAGGGWRVTAGDTKMDPRYMKLFDPEGTHHKLARIREIISDRSIDLLSGGLTAEGLAAELDVPVPMVRTVFEETAKKDPELRVSKKSGETLLYRGSSVVVKESSSMSITEWVRGLFSSEGDEAKKINVLSERRASLSARVDRMYDDIGKLEKKEEQLTTEGKNATSMVVKRRIAGQIARMRADIQRHNTSAALLSKQINIISTHIHNLELAQTGSIAQMPSGEELTEAAVNAEEMLEQLAASDDLVSSLEVSMAETAISQEEADILKELQGDTEKAPPAKTSIRAGESQSAAKDATRERGPGMAE